jgi:hypothetical protein
MIPHTNVNHDRIRSAILEHLHGFWPKSSISAEDWDKGPIRENVPGFRVLKLKSDTQQKPVVYVTEGCFASEPGEHIRHEFFLMSPHEEHQHVETLSMLANFHADERLKLDVGSVVSIGDSWLPGSICDHLLISMPYPYGPKLEWLKLSDLCVRFLWALPITSREAAFMELNGLEALEQKFDAATLDYLNPFRASVV